LTIHDSTHEINYRNPSHDDMLACVSFNPKITTITRSIIHKLTNGNSNQTNRNEQPNQPEKRRNIEKIQPKEQQKNKQMMSSHNSIQSSNNDEAKAREDQDVASLLTIPITTAETTGTGTKFIKCQITRLPQHGTLYDLTAPTTPLRSNDLLSKLIEINKIADKEGLTCSVLYKAEAGWFSIPDTMSNGTSIHDPTPIDPDWLEYRTVEIDPMWSLTEGIPSSSPSLPQRVIVQVQNSNDEPVLHIGNEEDGDKQNEKSIHDNGDDGTLLNVWTLSTLVGEDDSCWGDNDDDTQNELSSCKTKARLGNITLMDADRDVDRVRVDVRTGNGMLTIHPLDLSYVDFNTCSNRTRYYTYGDSGEDSTLSSSSLEWNNLHLSFEIFIFSTARRTTVRRCHFLRSQAMSAQYYPERPTKASYQATTQSTLQSTMAREVHVQTTKNVAFHWMKMVIRTPLITARVLL